MARARLYRRAGQAMSDRKPPVSVALDPAQWQIVINAVAEAPWKIANPIIAEVARALAPQQPPVGAVTGQPLVSPPAPIPPIPAASAFDKLKEQIR
jgi:hypothetical protein